MKQSEIWNFNLPELSDPIDVREITRNFELIDLGLEAAMCRKTRKTNTLSEQAYPPAIRIKNYNDFDVVVVDRAMLGTKIEVKSKETKVINFRQIRPANFFVEGLHEVTFEWYIPTEKAIEEGGGAISNYNELENQPKVNGVTLTGNKSFQDLGLLNSDGVIKSDFLPPFVDNMDSYPSKANFPAEGVEDRLYLAKDTNLAYVWTGVGEDKYACVGTSLALGETSSTAYRGDRGKTAYEHSQSTHARTDATKTEASQTNGNIKINGTETPVYQHPGTGTNPHGTTKSDVGLGNVGNFKAVSTVASQGLTDTEKSNARANIGLGDASGKGVDTSITTSASDNNIPTSKAVKSYVDTEISNLPEPMIFKGSLGTGGTITSLPTAAKANTGFTYKVITAGTYASQAAKVGDTFISTGSAWELIPSGDEPSGTVTSVAMTVPTGLSVSGSPITSSGTLAVSMASGYSIPTTANQTNWNKTNYGKVKINEVSIDSGSHGDTIQFVEGSNVTLTADTTNKKVTIAAKDTTYSNFVGSGSTSKAGLVPSPGTTAGTTKYLREDGSWQTPPNTTYSSKSAVSGGTDVSLVTTGEKYAWNNKASTATATTDANGLMSSSDKTKLNGIAAGATAVSEETVSGWGFTKNAGTYSKPSTGIPATDLASAVQTSLGKADTALQSYTEKYTGTVTMVKVGTSEYSPSSGVVSLPAYPTTLPASNTTDTYSSTGTAPVSGKAVASAISGKLDSNQKGASGGVAELDANGKVLSSQLPSYVDDVVEASSKSAFPTAGESGKIYVDTTANLTYRWTGTAYTEISPSIALGETASTAFRGDHGKTAYDHATTTATNPHKTTKSDVGLGNVGNFKAVSTVASQGLTDTEKSNARANIGAGTYSKASTGIPKTDLASAVQTSLGLADTALQSHQSLADYVKTTDSRLTDARASNDVQAYAKTGSGITVAKSVPSDAKFTDTTYSAATTSANGLMSSSDKTKLNGIATGATAVSESTVSGWGFTKNAGTVTKVKVGSSGTEYSPSSGIVTIPAYPTSLPASDVQAYAKTGSGITVGVSVPANAKFTDTTYSSKTAASGGTDVSLVTTGEKYTWNNKQNALSSQTAYSAKGSATKVPQITTNSLGQVTGITEVAITQPTVNNATLTIQKNGKNVGTFTANASTNSTVNITVPTGASANKGIDTSIASSATDNNVPTTKAVKTALDDKVTKTSVSSGVNSTTSVINVTDAKTQMAMVAKIKGKTVKVGDELHSAPVESVVSQSKNLFDLTSWFANSAGVTRGTVEPTSNGFKMTCTTTGDAYTNTYEGSRGLRIKVKPSTTYELAWNSDNSNEGTALIFINDTNSTIGNPITNSTKRANFTTPANIKYIAIRFGVTKVNTSITYSDIRLTETTGSSDYTPYYKTTVLVPREILNLPDYGVEGNTVDFENMVYTHVNTIEADGSAVQALSATETIPITARIRPLPVEAGGTLTLVNEHNLDVANVVKYKKEV